MPRANFSLSIPEAVWIGELSRSYPEAVFRVLAAIPGADVGAGLVEVRHPDVEELLADFRSFDAVTELEVMRRSDDQALVQFETDAPLLLFAVQESGIPIQTPFDVVDGEVSWVVTAPHDRISELSEQFEALGIPYEVERIEQDIDSERLLTEKQASLVEAALERGYYDTPRTCTLVELAEDLDMAASTVSETLHRAEERLVKSVMEQRRDPSRSSASPPDSE